MSPAHRSLRRAPSKTQGFPLPSKHPRTHRRPSDVVTAILNPHVLHGPAKPCALQPPSRYCGSRGGLLTQVTKPLQSVSTFKNSASSISSDTPLTIFFMALMKAFLSRASKEKKEHHPLYHKSLSPITGVPGCLGAGEGHTEDHICRLPFCISSVQCSIIPQILAAPLPHKSTALAPQQGSRGY